MYLDLHCARHGVFAHEGCRADGDVHRAVADRQNRHVGRRHTSRLQLQTQGDQFQRL